MAKENEIVELKRLLKTRKINISLEEIRNKVERIRESQQIFPMIQQQTLLIQLWHLYEKSKRKAVLLLEELGGKKIPVTIVLAILAEDWPGMSNSVLGIIHQKEGNVLFLKGFTIPHGSTTVGFIILAFVLKTQKEYAQFLIDKPNLLALIRDASLGSRSKTLLLEDETIKFEIYTQCVKKIKKIYKGSDIQDIIGESGEALKFFSSRSREYLEERKVADLAEFILDNHRFQKLVRDGKTDNRIKIKNFETKFERLTGITFVCWEVNFSIENFLKTLEFIVPGHLIKHHKSFVSSDGILVYRIEILDSEENPLNPGMVKSIETSLTKQISSAFDEKFTRIKSIGGYEHFGRAIIPFLMEELVKTRTNQVFLSVDKKNDFQIHIKLILVSIKSERNRLNPLIRQLEKEKGIEIFSVIPPRLYRSQIEVIILNLRAKLAEFPSIRSIFHTIKEILKGIFGPIRDFDEGLREADWRVLHELTVELKTVHRQLIREIFFNFDELYRVETPVAILSEIIRTCHETIKRANRESIQKIIVNYKHIVQPQGNLSSKTVFVISSAWEKKILGTLIKKLKDIQMYFTRIEWNQRFYLILILKKGDRSLSPADIESIHKEFLAKISKNILIMSEKDRDG
jgi:hypothetical protein